MNQNQFNEEMERYKFQKNILFKEFRSIRPMYSYVTFPVVLNVLLFFAILAHITTRKI